MNDVNINKNTFERVKQDFECEERGKVEVKNWGLIRMYFVVDANEKYPQPVVEV